MTFLITGYGRSGTKFLSEKMNLSKTWTVEHEPRKNAAEIISQDRRLIYFKKTLVPVFTKNHNYGEVNGKLKYYIDYFIKFLPEVKLGILLRNPFDVFLSIMNRREENIKEYKFFVDDICKRYEEFFKHIQQNNIPPIFFEEMVKNLDYLKNIMVYYGIEDVNINQIDLSVKVNQNKVIKYQKYKKLPANVKEYADKRLLKVKEKFDILYQKDTFFEG